MAGPVHVCGGKAFGQEVLGQRREGVDYDLIVRHAVPDDVRQAPDRRTVAFREGDDRQEGPQQRPHHRTDRPAAGDGLQALQQHVHHVLEHADRAQIVVEDL